ncbi:D-2-hydroxyacid dehydrogenase [Fulvivirga sediminis]|uniref:D-2-hydroxyacid dehydrogenase n=1 Tax=Fulvivirga sediminis TaxID=2803949 RepID=A0A937F1G6_9BACT|nr:D-2-hydroxyacid dehydrogenase [Fulvivirga sediminis]MBL3654531.1 D-2-hydroxyacid dehydrogenase [Fulvivirga sediminis]
MKIVVLDSFTINAFPEYWEPFKKLGSIALYEKSSQDEIVERAKNADAVILNKCRMTRSIIEQLPKLKYIGLTGTGFDHVDLVAAKKHHITVTNAPGYGVVSIAQHTFGLLLQLTNRINSESKNLEWVRDNNFSYYTNPMIELHGKTIGILGWGATGKEVAKIANGFGMKVLVHSKHAVETNVGTLVNIEKLFSKSDVISIHVSLKQETTNLVNESLLKLMKPSAYLINTSRGAVINEEDLVKALNQNQIAGAGLDVLTQEPPSDNDPLLTAKNCIITPHISWMTAEAQHRLQEIVLKNLKQFMKGNPIHVVS